MAVPLWAVRSTLLPILGGTKLDLESLGWNQAFASAFSEAAGTNTLLQPARVTREDRELYRVAGPFGEAEARVTGSYRNASASRVDFPAVGDWVAVRADAPDALATIYALLPRRTCVSRKVAGSVIDEQVIVANVDTVFVVVGLDGDYHPRRVERYLTQVWETGAQPVLLLNKADLCADPGAHQREMESLALGVPVVTVSALDGSGLDRLAPYLRAGQTVGLMGSSGVGKSTLVNALLGAQELRVGDLRRGDGRGRHTTTHRELIVLPGGALMADVPGMRELQLWATDEGLSGAFDDIESLAASCRFADCSHQGEPGCAVREALDDGRLSAGRLRNYQKMERELRHLALQQDARLRSAQRDEVRRRNRAMRQREEATRKGWVR